MLAPSSYTGFSPGSASVPVAPLGRDDGWSDDELVTQAFDERSEIGASSPVDEGDATAPGSAWANRGVPERQPARGSRPLAPVPNYLGEAAPFDPLEPFEAPVVDDGVGLPAVDEEEDAALELEEIAGLYSAPPRAPGRGGPPDSGGPDESTDDSQPSFDMARAISEELGEVDEIDSDEFELGHIEDGNLIHPPDVDRTTVEASVGSATLVEVDYATVEEMSMRSSEREETSVGLAPDASGSIPLVDGDELGQADDAKVETLEAVDHTLVLGESEAGDDLELEAVDHTLVLAESEAAGDGVELEAVDHTLMLGEPEPELEEDVSLGAEAEAEAIDHGFEGLGTEDEDRVEDDADDLERDPEAVEYDAGADDDEDRVEVDSDAIEYDDDDDWDIVAGAAGAEADEYDAAVEHEADGDAGDDEYDAAVEHEADGYAGDDEYDAAVEHEADGYGGDDEYDAAVEHEADGYGGDDEYDAAVEHEADGYGGDGGDGGDEYDADEYAADEYDEYDAVEYDADAVEDEADSSDTARIDCEPQADAWPLVDAFEAVPEADPNECDTARIDCEPVADAPPLDDSPDETSDAVPQSMPLDHTEVARIEPQPSTGYGDDDDLSGFTMVMPLADVLAQPSPTRPSPEDDAGVPHPMPDAGAPEAPARTGHTEAIDLRELKARSEAAGPSSAPSPAWAAEEETSSGASWTSASPSAPPSSSAAEGGPSVGAAFDLQEMLARFDATGVEVELISPEASRGSEPDDDDLERTTPGHELELELEPEPDEPRLRGDLQAALDRLRRRESASAKPAGAKPATDADADADASAEVSDDEKTAKPGGSRRQRRGEGGHKISGARSDSPELVALYRAALADIE